MGHGLPFQEPRALLSFVEPRDVAFTARVEVDGRETVEEVHRLVQDVMGFMDVQLGEREAGTALEITLGRRHQLALHSDHVLGLTRLLYDATHVIDSAGPPGEGRCLHCHGTGTARPLWEPRSTNLPG
ncbi:hypothetical protein [Streptomyces sp. NPDC058620]|uniref:hypothetical protein n=1 Tax=Streptomyces sp. NPDC058620 TaxID=3346560 RepID=UPI00365C280E